MSESVSRSQSDSATEMPISVPVVSHQADPSTSAADWLTLPPPYPVRRFSVAEYYAIARAGILTEDDNVELLEGWIVPKMTKHPPHDSTIDRVNYLLNRLLPAGWYVRVQNSAVTKDSVPEPDLAVVRGVPGDYGDQHPTGPDFGLIVEVSDSTVPRDRRKAGIYARAGVREYWIVNLDDRQIETFAKLTGKGAKAVYQDRQILRNTDDSLTLSLDGVAVGALQIREVLGQ